MPVRRILHPYAGSYWVVRTLRADATLSAFVLNEGDGRRRIYRRGNIPSNPVFPYLVYEQVPGVGLDMNDENHPRLATANFIVALAMRNDYLPANWTEGMLEYLSPETADGGMLGQLQRVTCGVRNQFGQWIGPSNLTPSGPVWSSRFSDFYHADYPQGVANVVEAGVRIILQWTSGAA